MLRRTSLAIPLQHVHPLALVSSCSGSSIFRWCATSQQQQQQQQEQSKQEEAPELAPGSREASIFVPVRALRRLGEEAYFVRRACTSMPAEKVVPIAARLFELHKKRIGTLRQLYSTSRFNVPKRLMLKWTLRATALRLYTTRLKVRGWAALADVAVVLVLMSAFFFLFCGFRALAVWMRRMAYIEQLTQQVMGTVTELQEHGNDGQKFMEERKKLQQQQVAKQEASPTASKS